MYQRYVGACKIHFIIRLPQHHEDQTNKYSLKSWAFKGTLTHSVPENLRKIDSRLKVSYCAKRLMVVLPN